MSPRDRRLAVDLAQMTELTDRGELTFRVSGNPPDRYEAMFSVPGLARDEAGRLTVRRLHRCEIYLHREYPRRPPVVTWQTPIFHPNILPPARNGGVCLGSWSPSEGLADVCARLVELVSYRDFNAGDALDVEAAAWVRAHDVRPGTPVADLAGLAVDPEVAISAAGMAS